MDFLGTSQKEAQFPFPWFNCLWNLKSRLLNELLGPIKEFLRRLFRRSNFSWWTILLFEHQKNMESLWIDLKEPIIGFTNLFDLLFKSPFQPCLFMYKAFIPCLNTHSFLFESCQPSSYSLDSFNRKVIQPYSKRKGVVLILSAIKLILN